MRISSIQVKNFKSFLSSEEINFTSGFNVIVGQNNVGKTALVEALSLKFENKPHRSLKTVPTSNITPDPQSNVNISFELSRNELVELLNNTGGFYVPVSESAQFNDKFLREPSEQYIIKCAFLPINTFNSTYLVSHGAPLDPNQHVQVAQL